MVELTREPAKRLFAGEIRNTTIKIDGKPAYAVTPLGTKVSRVMIAGAVTRVVEKNPEYNVYLVGIADPTGSIATFISKFQPDALSMLIEQNIQEFDLVGIVGKLRVIEIENFLRPIVRVEAINRISKDEYLIWMFEALKYLQKRIKEFDPENEIVKNVYRTRIEDYQALAERVKGVLKDELNIEDETEFFEEDISLEDIVKDEEDFEHLLKR